MVLLSNSNFTLNSYIDMEELKIREKKIQEPEPPVKTNDPD